MTLAAGVQIGAVALVLAGRLVPANPRPAPRSQIDVVGAVLLGLAVLCVLLPIVQSEAGGLRRLELRTRRVVNLVASAPEGA